MPNRPPELTEFYVRLEFMDHTYGEAGPTTYDLGDEIIYSKVRWHMPNPPTKAEFEQALLAYRDYRHRTIEYKENRLAEYPRLGELADAIYWERKGDPSFMTEYLAKVDAVKAKYPKP